MNIFHHIKHLRTYSSEPEYARTLFVWYWQVLVVSMFGLVVCVFVYGGWQLFTVMNDASSEQSNTTIGTKSTPINSLQVDMVLQGFAERQAQFETYKATTTRIIDPSL
ncbi:hypothetical protein HZC00_01980 [Candidatus Kaiserbacteria bacterium]|nr:hypothetical protein [Candidatus Kaiserbacteria bacterium]